MSDSLTEHETDLVSNDSDAEGSQSVCSDTHSDTASGITEKSTLSGSTIQASLGNDDNSTNPSSIADSESKSASRNVYSRDILLPWGAQKERTSSQVPGMAVDMDIRPGEFVMRSLFAVFTVMAEKKIDSVLNDSQVKEKTLSKALQRGEDAQFDQLLSAFGSVAEHCLPSLLRALFSWYERQMSEVTIPEHKKTDPKQQKSIISIVSGGTTETAERSEAEVQKEKRDLAVEFIFCLVLIEVLKQLSFHPGHEDLVQYIENLAFKHFKYKEGIQNNPNGANIHIIADLYAEVVGVLAQSRFMSVRTRFMNELKELRSREPGPITTQSIISLLMGMKFFRVKMVPIEEFEASFQFMQECAQYFLEVKDKDIKHALAGLFVEILVPVAAAVKNEVNVPCLKHFVETLFFQGLDSINKSKHRLALFPLLTCLLCVSQKQFFLQNWPCFLTICLQHLRNRDLKMCRVALESMYRLLWVYVIRLKCESNSVTQSRIQSIVNSLFPKGSKVVVPRDTPLNIFVKIIHFIAQERLDFAMKEIVYDLLSVGKPIKIILTPERMSIGLRAFLVVADSLQEKEGEPPMPRSVGVMPSGNTLRVKKTFKNKVLTEDTIGTIGMSSYFPPVRTAFAEILVLLDSAFGKPFLMTNSQNLLKPEELMLGERKPKMDLFRTCVAAVPRLIPDDMTSAELVDLLSRLTVHMDEEVRALAYQSLQTLVIDLPDWRHDVIWGLTQFLMKDILDTYPQLMDNGLKMVLNLLITWKNAITGSNTVPRMSRDYNEFKSSVVDSTLTKKTDTVKIETLTSALNLVEALAMVMLCNNRLTTRRVSVLILKEVKTLFKLLNITNIQAAIEIMDKCCPEIVKKYLYLLPPAEKSAVQATLSIDLQWLSERNSSVWTAGLCEDGTIKSLNSSSFTVVDPWCSILFDFFDTGRLIDQCPTLVSNIWPIVFSRLNTLYTVVDLTPLSDNRASILRSSTAVKKTPSEKDAYLHLWKNYVTLAFRVLPKITPNIPIPQPIRCVSPDSSSGSNTDSSLSSNEKIENKLASVSPTGLYKLVVPFLRCEGPDVRDTTIYALGHIHHDALGDLLEELVPYIKEITEKKQENVRRRRRKNPLRLTLIKLFEQLAEKGTLGVSSWAFDKNRLTLIPQITEFIEAVRYYLELEPDKTSVGAKELILHFCNFIKKMFENFDLERRANLLKRDLRKKIFLLFSQSAGKYGLKPSPTSDGDQEKISDFQYAVLQSMSAVLCCGPCFSPSDWVEDSPYYLWLDTMLNSSEEKVFKLAQETVILLLEANPDIGLLVDWLIEKCFTYSYPVADECFLALSYMFSTREYPCDHYYAVINVTLMNTGCPRTHIRDTALQLLQILDKRFFGSVSPHLESESGEGTRRKGTLDSLLATTFCRSQVYLSSQLAHLHPELTMPMFSEITYRFNTARSDIRPMLLEYILPWLHNMELVDPNVPPQYYQYYSSESGRTKRDGWGSSEATEMVLNNMFYLTAKFGDYHPKEIELVWKTLCSSWPNNMRVIIRYLIIISGMAPTELLPYAKRVVLYLARVQPTKLFDEMMTELQTVESLNFNIERTETPPFYRLTMMRKTSSHSDGNTGQVDSNSRHDLSVEKGTIHTKRHSGEDPSKASNVLGDFAMEKCKNPEDMYSSSEENANQDKCDMPIPQPHPLPMPEYGGYFAPLSDYLPDSSQPISSFHRCNIGVMLLCDVVIDGLELDWTIHVPLMLHVAFLGLDHTRPLVHTHCKQLLLNLLIVIAQHNDYLTVAQILLTTKTEELELGLSIPALPVISHNYTEPDPVFDACLRSATHPPEGDVSKLPSIDPPSESEELTESEEETSDQVAKPPDVTILTTSSSTTPKLEQSTPNIIKSLIAFLAKRNDDSPLWSYEDITAKVWSIKSAEQMETLLQHVVRVFRESLPLGHINERWAQTALQLGLSCSSRHYAGRSLQIFRALKVPITTRMLSDILSRLVETVAEQGEDMQGYVTELLLTLEAAVDSLESDFRPIDCMKEFFKSTPNLNNKETAPKKGMGEGQSNVIPQISYQLQGGHARSTSYSVSYGFKKSTSSPNDNKDRGRSSHEPDHKIPLNKFASNLARSRSAQSLKMLGDSATQDDKMTILAQLFWLAVSLLESDYEHEFLLAVRLLKRVLHRLPLDRPDARDKVEKLQQQLRWNSFPGVHALLLKGCTHPNTYEPVMELLSQLTLLLNLSVIDPSQNIAFPMNVIALLPYLLLNYEDANELCIRAAENIAQVSIEKSKKLENLGTVMNLYSRKTFSKESFQWTKCVIKYLYDTYSYLSLNMLTFLVEILEKGPSTLQLAVLNIIHCMLHYVDLASAACQPINADLLRVIVKYIDGVHWKEALKILKLVVSRSSSLVTPPSSSYSQWESSLSTTSHANFGEDNSFSKKELPGRTMDFTFDLSQTPVIGRKYLNTKEETTNSSKVVATPRRSCSLSPADVVPQSGWKRPWMCQGRVRECLVNLLTTCGQRVGLPKSPSVIFSQTSDLIERQSSMASSTEEVSLGNNDASGGSRRDETATDFGVFKDFDFLEYESESIEGESTDNFNWGVRRRPLSQGDHLRHGEDSVSELTPVLTSRKKMVEGESSDEEIESESPLDEIVAGPEFENNAGEGPSGVFPPASLNLRDPVAQIISSGRSDTSGSSAGDLGEVTPCNASPNIAGMQRPQMRLDALENYQSYVDLLQSPPTSPHFFQQLHKLVKTVCQASFESSREACSYLSHSSISGQPIIKLINSRLNSVIDCITFRIMVPNLVWFNQNAVAHLNLGEILKCAILQVQEHLELFCDKKQQLTMYCDAVKTTLKLEMLSGQPSEYRHDQYFVDLGKSIFKLYFQLLLLVEAVNKLVCLLHTTLLAADFKDMTPEVITIRNALARTFEDTEADGGVASSSAPEESDESYETRITRYLDRQEWTQCVLYFKQHRSEIIREYEDICDRDDDIHTILNIYCRRKMTERPDHSTNTNQQPDSSDIFGRLFQFSSAASELENLFKDQQPS